MCHLLRGITLSSNGTWYWKKISNWPIGFILSKNMFLPPANKVCKGNVFTGVCLSTGGLSLCPGRDLCPGALCPGGLCPGGLCSGGSLSGGVYVQGSLSGGSRSLSMGSLSRGCLCPGGCLSRGVSIQGVSVQGSLSRGYLSWRLPHMEMRMQYASYWDAFLLSTGMDWIGWFGLISETN